MTASKFFAISLLSIAVAAATSADAALQIDELGTGSIDALALANTLLSGSSGITLSNVQFVGTTLQAGAFGNAKSAGLSFDSGIVLSTGKVRDLPIGPASFNADTILGQPGDPLLTALVGTKTLDAAVLKFDFVPTGDKVQFSYVFGSSEYNMFVGTHYNDTFGFFVNGSNVALIPGTSTSVAINNINCGTSDYSAPGVGTNCDLFIDNRKDDGVNGKNLGINLGGFTKTFSFVASVNPNVTNTMYLAIGDATDARLDSAVFISGGSFSVCGSGSSPACPIVPEPSTYAFLGAAIGLMLLVGRRRKDLSV
ncbi:MAG: choice-of-anchor L domain-containing protein [Betaproteobacteria bacterium]